MTGYCSKKAYEEAKRYGQINIAASSEGDNFSYIPDCSDLEISLDSDYVYISENNTIYGTKFKVCPNSKGKVLINDISSCFLSEPMNVSDYGINFCSSSYGREICTENIQTDMVNGNRLIGYKGNEQNIE